MSPSQPFGSFLRVEGLGRVAGQKEVLALQTWAAIRWNEVREETAELLSELIRIDTTNPPGNETEAARFLLKRFEAEGLQGEIWESAPGRGNLLVRLRGSRPGPTLMLLNHTDVVPVTDASAWKHPPFSGAIAEGYVWGRGALDMKHQTAIEALTLLLFKRLGLDFGGELLYLACADEEKGADYGAAWLMQHHADRIRADYVINEGGGMPIQVLDRTFYTVETGEKGLLWLKVTFKGTSGHASVPHADNALAKAARFVRRVVHYRFPKVVSPTVGELIRRLTDAFGPAGRGLAEEILSEHKEADLEQALAGFPVRPEHVHALTHTTISPTTIQAGVKENVIPDRCTLTLDCRLVPGQDKDEVIEALYRLAADLDQDIELEVLQHHSPSESALASPLYEAIAQVIAEEHPQAGVVPMLLTGATDSRFFREAGALAYGFCPLSTRMSLAERSRLIHNDNERIDLESLELGVRWTLRIAMKVLGVEGA